jgi:transposase-like protein
MLVLASSVCGLFKWRQFEPEVILLAVGWYLRFSLSYRDVEELLGERGVHADHATVCDDASNDMRPSCSGAYGAT